jgi:hypothetical protein
MYDAKLVVSLGLQADANLSYVFCTQNNLRDINFCDMFFFSFLGNAIYDCYTIDLKCSIVFKNIIFILP